MKKILFFIAMVVMIAAVASAQASVSVSGAFKTSFGVDLDTFDTGFTGGFVDGFKITIKPQVESDVVQSAVEDGDTAYGQVGVNGLALVVEGAPTGYVGYGGAPTVQMTTGGAWAKLVLGNLTIGLWSGAEAVINYMGAAQGDYYLQNAYAYSVFDGEYGGGNATKAKENWDGVKDKFDPMGIKDDIAGGYGIEVALSLPDVMNIAIDVKSHDDWAKSTNVYDNEYAFKAAVDLTAVENLTFGAGANFSNYTTDDTWAVGAKVGYTIGIGESDSIMPIAAVTYDSGSNGNLWIAGGVDAAIAGIDITGYVAYNSPDLTGTTSNLNYTVALNMGAVENLTAQAALEMTNAMAGAATTTGMAIHGKIGYAIAAGDITITPSAQASYDDPDSTVTLDDALYAKVEVAVAGLLDNTTFYLNWDSNDLSDHENSVATEILGQLVLSAKISF